MTAGGIRRPVVAGQFYEGGRAALERAVASCVGDYLVPDDLGDVVGGVVPHAGWVYSGPTAAKVFRALAERAQPEVYVLLGAVHRWGAVHAEVYPAGAWATPLGEAVVDEELSAAIVQAGGGLVAASTEAHQEEHSIEVQVPFVQVLSPGAAIVAVAVPPGVEAVKVGEAIGAAIRSSAKKAVVVASSDLTHYGMGYGVPDHGPLPGAMPWMRENDMRIVRLAEALEAGRICPEAAAHHNACGAGAMAAAVSGARILGAERGRLLEYTTSADVLRETCADRAVGYAGIVFEREAARG